MRWTLAAGCAGLALAGCLPAAPAATPPPAASELLVVPAPDGGHEVVSTLDASVVATLPAGALATLTTAGGDFGETYIAGAGGVWSVAAGRPFRATRVADPPGPAPLQAALVEAPTVSSFVGARTVLVVLAADGAVAGFQHGAVIWRSGVRPGSELRTAGGQALVGSGGDWAIVQPADGLRLPAATDCTQGPLAGITGRPVFACAGVTPAADRLPIEGSGPSVELRPVRGGDPTVAFADGRWARLGPGPAIRATGRGRGGGLPAGAPDGSALYWPADAGAESVATSRDGTRLYALGGGRLRVLTLPGLGVERSFSLEAPRIELAAGG